MDKFSIFPMMAVASFASVAVASPLQGLSADVSSTAYGVNYMVYADLDAGARIDAVYGDGSSSLSIHAGAGGFYQNIYGGDTSVSINPSLLPVFPSLAYDTYVTIGLTDSTANALNVVGNLFTNWVETDNGSWFATPEDDQCLAGSELRVMIGQFTMIGADATVSGVVNLQGKVGDFETFNATGQAFEYSMIPAPGALALLGLAGIASRRRRK